MAFALGDRRQIVDEVDEIDHCRLRRCFGQSAIQDEIRSASAAA